MERITIEECKRSFKVAMDKWSVITGRAIKFGSDYAMDIISYLITNYGQDNKVVFTEPISEVPDSLKGYYICPIAAISVKGQTFCFHDVQRNFYEVSFTFKDKETTQFIMDKVLESIDW